MSRRRRNRTTGQMVRTTVRVPNRIAESLAKLSNESGKTRSEIIRRLLDAGLALRGAW